MAESVMIDLVTEDRANNEWVLYLVEDGPWPSGEDGWKAELKGIQDRILRAVDVAVDGYLAAKYPDSKRVPIRVEVDSPRGCPSQLEELVFAVSEFLRSDAAYSTAIKNSTYIGGLRVVTGTQMGRFK